MILFFKLMHVNYNFLVLIRYYFFWLIYSCVGKLEKGKEMYVV